MSTMLTTETKVSPALLALNNAIAQADGALQRSGGTMTGNIVLAEEATADMHPVAKKTLDKAIEDINTKMIVATIVFGG